MKNQSVRTQLKQSFLAHFVKFDVLIKQAQKYTYIDANAGKGSYTVNEEVVPGSPIQIYGVFRRDSDIKDKIPEFQHNGYLFEKNRKYFRELTGIINGYNHNFVAINRGNENIPALKDAKPLYNDGIVYFDPEGSQNPRPVQAAHRTIPNYSILANLQRNSTVRWIRRQEYNSVKDICGLEKHWLISRPTGKMGWCWLYGASTQQQMEAMQTLMYEKDPNTPLHTLQSPEGACYFRLMTEVGHSIKDY